VLGVNGVGKTTTVGKLAWRLKENGHRVLLSCADTFRAAASEQLEIWGKRVGVEVVRSQLHADPAAVVFDALTAAFHRKVDFLLVDTAGRFHHRQNLIEEAKKIKKIIKKRYPPAPQETLLVIDATTGQNALEQVRTFHQELEITGVVLTKLDGTAKGGTVVAIRDIIGVPIKLVGLGEEKTALKNFDPVLFTEALF
jgi:fused signal recognition particle receptor